LPRNVESEPGTRFAYVGESKNFPEKFWAKVDTVYIDWGNLNPEKLQNRKIIMIVWA
jgi:hypothetical protein